MSELPTNIERQKRNGYLMLAGAVAILVGSVAAFFYYDFSPFSYLGVLVPVGILTFFGYRAVAAGSERKALGDERTDELYGKVGLNAFWMLMTVLIIDMAWDILPENRASMIYVLTGLFFYGAYFIYYRYMS